MDEAYLKRKDFAIPFCLPEADWCAWRSIKAEDGFLLTPTYIKHNFIDYVLAECLNESHSTASASSAPPSTGFFQTLDDVKHLLCSIDVRQSYGRTLIFQAEFTLPPSEREALLDSLTSALLIPEHDLSRMEWLPLYYCLIAALYRRTGSYFTTRLNELPIGNHLINALQMSNNKAQKHPNLLPTWIWTIFEQQTTTSNPVPVSLLHSIVPSVQHIESTSDLHATVYILSHLILSWITMLRSVSSSALPFSQSDIELLLMNLHDLIRHINTLTRCAQSPTDSSNLPHHNRPTGTKLEYFGLASWLFRCMANCLYDFGLRASTPVRLSVISTCLDFISSVPLNASCSLLTQEVFDYGWCMSTIVCAMRTTLEEKQEGLLLELRQEVTNMFLDQHALCLGRCMMPSSFADPHPWLSAMTLKVVRAFSSSNGKMTKVMWNCEPLRLSFASCLHIHCLFPGYFLFEGMDTCLKKLKHLLDLIGPLLPLDAFNWLPDELDCVKWISSVLLRHIDLLIPQMECQTAYSNYCILQNLKLCAFGRFYKYRIEETGYASGPSTTYSWCLAVEVDDIWLRTRCSSTKSTTTIDDSIYSLCRMGLDPDGSRCSARGYLDSQTCLPPAEDYPLFDMAFSATFTSQPELPGLDGFLTHLSQSLRPSFVEAWLGHLDPHDNDLQMPFLYESWLVFSCTLLSNSDPLLASSEFLSTKHPMAEMKVERQLSGQSERVTLINASAVNGGAALLNPNFITAELRKRLPNGKGALLFCPCSDTFVLESYGGFEEGDPHYFGWTRCLYLHRYLQPAIYHTLKYNRISPFVAVFFVPEERMEAFESFANCIDLPDPKLPTPHTECLWAQGIQESKCHFEDTTPLVEALNSADAVHGHIPILDETGAIQSFQHAPIDTVSPLDTNICRLPHTMANTDLAKVESRKCSLRHILEQPSRRFLEGDDEHIAYTQIALREKAASAVLELDQVFLWFPELSSPGLEAYSGHPLDRGVPYYCDPSC